MGNLPGIKKRSKKYEKIFIFRYGSNMDVRQMKERCQGAIRMKPAVLHDYKLTERLYADIDESAGRHVSGILWSISEKDLKNLDIYEGFPTFYTRKTVHVTNCNTFGNK